MTFLLIFGFLLFGGGVWAAYFVGTQVAVSRYRRLTGLDKQTFKRYREAAQLLNDLEFNADFDDNLTILPPLLSARVTRWNKDHRKAITG